MVNVEAHRTSDKQNQYYTDIGKLLEENDNRKEEIEVEKRRIARTKAKVEALEKQVKELNKSMGGTLQLQEYHMKSRRRSKTLEGNLERANKRLNTQLVNNRHTRDRIADMRLARRRNDECCEGLERELEALKREQKSFVQASMLSMETRDEANQKICFLREKELKDQRLNRRETAALQLFIDQDTYGQAFMTEKLKKRLETQQQRQWKDKAGKQRREKELEMEQQRIQDMKDTLEFFRRETNSTDHAEISRK